MSALAAPRPFEANASSRFSALRMIDIFSTYSAASRLHRGARFPVHLASSDRFTFVVRLLSFNEREVHLHASILEIELQRHEREPLLIDLARNPLNLVPVKKQLPLTALVMMRVA